MCPVSQSLHQQRVGARSVGEKSISHRGRHDPQSSARHRAHARLTRRASEWPTARRLLAEDEDQSFAGARSTLLPLLHSWRAIAGPSLLVSMQLSSRGPSGPEHRARLLSWKDHPRRGRYGVPTRRAGAIRDRHRTPPPPPPSTSIRYHAYGEKGTEGRARRAGARHPRQGDRSGRTSAVVLASAARLRGRATTRSPCRLMGYCPHRREGHMRCGTRDGRALSRRRRLDPRLLVVRRRRATTEPWAARNGAKAARGALVSALCGHSPRLARSTLARAKRVSRTRLRGRRYCSQGTGRSSETAAGSSEGAVGVSQNRASIGSSFRGKQRRRADRSRLLAAGDAGSRTSGENQV